MRWELLTCVCIVAPVVRFACPSSGLVCAPAFGAGTGGADSMARVNAFVSTWDDNIVAALARLVAQSPRAAWYAWPACRVLSVVCTESLV